MPLVPTISDGDWGSVRKAIQLLASDQRLGYGASPIFDSITLRGGLAISGNATISGNLTLNLSNVILKVNNNGVVQEALADTDYLTPSTAASTYQPLLPTPETNKFLSFNGTNLIWAEVIMTETDPIFTAWDKSTGISITKSQVVDFGEYEPPITGGTSAQYWRGDKTWQTLNQAAVDGLKATDSPTFAGLTLTGFGGFLKATGGVVGTSTIDISSDTNLAVSSPITLSDDTLGLSYDTANLKLTSNQLNTIQDIGTSSTPTFAGLTIGSATGLLKRTAGVLETAVADTDYLTPSTASSTYVPYTGATTNVDLGTRNLTTTGAIAGTSLTVSSLTSGRVTYATTGGQLVDSNNLLFNGTTLTAGGLTSTRHLTLAGLLTNTMTSTDVMGLSIDGDTNPYTWSSGNFTAFETKRKITGSGSSMVSQGFGFVRSLTWDYDFSGISNSFGNGKQINADGGNLLYTGDIAIIGGLTSPSRSVFRGNFSATTFSGAFSNSTTRSVIADWEGGYFQSINGASSITITNSGANTLDFVGGYFVGGCNALPSISISGGGSLRLQYAGGIFAGITRDSTATADTAYGGVFVAHIGNDNWPTLPTPVDGVTYGGYFKATGGTTNWAIYNVAGDVFLASTTAKTYFRDTDIHIASLDDGHLDLTADVSVDLNATTVAKTILPDTDNTYYLGEIGSPFKAYKGVILKDQGGTGKHYKLEVYDNALRIVALD